MKETTYHRRPVTISEHELATRCARGRVVIIDDDPEIISAFAALISFVGYAVESYVSALDYLQVLNSNLPCFPGPCCVLCDVNMPELDGLELQNRLAELDSTPMVLMSGSSGVQAVVSAFHAGALDFLIKPIDADILLNAVKKALAVSGERQALRSRQLTLSARISSLTEREHSIVRRVAAGHTNPEIAEEFGIALRTVKLHRQRAMEKLGVTKMTELVRIVDEGNL